MQVLKPHQRVSLAPMMDWTTPEFRALARLINPYVWLYSEMITSAALKHGDSKRMLFRFEDELHPHNLAQSVQPFGRSVLQLGGSDPSELALAACMGAKAGFNEINLNVGCPSSRVQKGMIGACLMAEPELVAQCLSAMRDAQDTPVTVKHRIGIDNLEDYSDLKRFVEASANQGFTHFIVHARIAVLGGLSPKENREVPPLRYEDVYRLKQDFKELYIEINGGIKDSKQVTEHLKHVDAVMIGREFYQRPEFMSELLPLYGQPQKSKEELFADFFHFLKQLSESGHLINHATRHALGLFAGRAGARKWRQQLSGKTQLSLADVEQAAAWVLEH